MRPARGRRRVSSSKVSMMTTLSTLALFLSAAAAASASGSAHAFDSPSRSGSSSSTAATAETVAAAAAAGGTGPVANREFVTRPHIADGSGMQLSSPDGEGSLAAGGMGMGMGLWLAERDAAFLRQIVGACQGASDLVACLEGEGLLSPPHVAAAYEYGQQADDDDTTSFALQRRASTNDSAASTTNPTALARKNAKNQKEQADPSSIVSSSSFATSQGALPTAFPAGVPSNPKCNGKKCATSSAASFSSSSAAPTSSNVVSTTEAATTTNATTSTYVSATSSSAAVTATPVSLGAKPYDYCVERYEDTSSGAVYGPGIPGFDHWSPRPTSFVVKGGTELWLDGEVYRVVGPNIYWLGLDENINWTPSYPDKGRVREAMAISVAMGANTIRAHTLGVSTGHSLSLMPSKGVVNTDAFDAIDYAIFAARNYGLRLIIPLTDEYQYYHGGKYDFIKWAGEDTSNGYVFYTSSTCLTLFKEYISVLLNHVNTYTGVALKDDPTIMAWETINEGGAYFLADGAPPQAWNTAVAQYIKSLAPNHLVLDGTDGLIDYSGVTRNQGLYSDGIDMVTDHFYPAANWLLNKDSGILSNYNRNYLVGELDWTGQKGGDSFESFAAILEGMKGSGSMIWSIFGHDGQCCDWITHNDGYSMYYPNGNSDYLQGQILKVIKHWYRMRGLTPPDSMPAVACPQPELTA